MRLWVLVCFFALHARAWSVEGGDGARELIKLEDGTRIQLQEFRGASKLAALQHLWETTEVVVECPQHKDFSVYTGPSVEAVRAAYTAKRPAWCGLERALGTHPACHASISPFGTTYVAVVKPRGWFEAVGAAATAGDGAPHSAACTMTRRSAFSMPRFLLSLVGTFLFWHAPQLGTSLPFRLTGGTLAFMALSSLLLLFILYRQVPHRRTLAVGTVLFGGSFLGALRYIFGTWAPSWGQLATNPIVLGYLVLSGLLGMALTYWYNNPNNHKIDTMLSTALQLTGLAMVAAGPTLTEASAAWVVLLLLARLAVLLEKYRSMGGVYRHAKRAAQDMAAVNGGSSLGVLQQRQPQQGEGLVFEGRGDKEAADAGAGPKPPRRLWVFGRQGESDNRAGEDWEGVSTPLGVGGGRVTGGGGESTVAGGKGRGRATSYAATPQEELEVSPLVKRGLLLNEETGHLIHIGKATYTRLLGSGYLVDRSKGVITPPPPSPTASPRGSSRGGARSRKASNKK